MSLGIMSITFILIEKFNFVKICSITDYTDQRLHISLTLDLSSLIFYFTDYLYTGSPKKHENLKTAWFFYRYFKKNERSFNKTKYMKNLRDASLIFFNYLTEA